MMISWTDAAIVTLIAIGSVILIAALGYLIEKDNEPPSDMSKRGGV